MEKITIKYSNEIKTPKEREEINSHLMDKLEPVLKRLAHKDYMKIELEFKNMNDSQPEDNRLLMIIIWYEEKNKPTASLINSNDLKPTDEHKKLIWWSYFNDSLAFKPIPS